MKNILCARRLGRFSIEWKNGLLFFHRVEKTVQTFPLSGKTGQKVSIEWKLIQSLLLACFLGIAWPAHASDWVVSTARVVSAFAEGEANPSTYFTVTCPGHKEGVPFTAWSTMAWMTVIPTSGHCPEAGVVIGIDYNVFDLPAGGHTGYVTVVSTEVTSPPIEVEIVLDIAPRELWLQRAPMEIEVSMERGSTNVMQFGVEIWNNASLGVEMHYSIAPRDHDGGDDAWLLVSPTNGMSTGERNFHTITLTNLAAFERGFYALSLDVECLETGVREDVYIDLLVLGTPGTADVTPESFSITTEQGINPPMTMMTITNTGEEAIGYRVAAAVPWLPTEIKRGGVFGGESAPVAIHVTSEDLAPGEYTTELMLFSPIDAFLPQRIPFSLTVTPANLVPQHSPLLLEASLQAGHSVTQQVQVWNAGTGTMAYAFSSGTPWLNISPTNGLSHAGEMQTHQVRFTAGALAPDGTREAFVQLSAPGATPDQRIVRMVMNVRPDLRCEPSYLSAVSPFAGSSVTVTAAVRNAGSPATYDFALSNLPPWLVASQISGTLSQQWQTITFEFDATDLEPGAHQALVHLVTEHATLPIPVLFDVVTPLAVTQERILFTSSREGQLQTWAIRPDGTGLMPLLDEEAPHRSARPSPDGRLIAYEREAGDTFLPWVRNLRTGGDIAHTLRPDVRWLADSSGFVGGDAAAERTLRLFHIEGASSRIYSEAPGAVPSVFGMNTASNLLYYSVRSGESHDMAIRTLVQSNDMWRPRLYVDRNPAAPDETIPRSHLVPPDTRARNHGSLNAAEDLLAYSRTGPRGTSPARIHVYELTWQREVALNDSVDPNYSDHAPAFSPGGDRLVFTRQWAHSNALVIVNLATREETVLLAEADAMTDIAWSRLLLDVEDDRHLDVSPLWVTNTFYAGTARSPTNVVTLQNAGSIYMPFTLEHLTDWTWSSVSGGASTGEVVTVEVGVHTEMLDIGTYTGEVRVVAEATNSPISLFVVAEVLPPPGVVAVHTTNMTCVVTQGGEEVLPLWIWNAGVSSLSYTVMVDRAWLWVDPKSGSSEGETNVVNVTFHAGMFPVGSMTGHVTVASQTSTQVVQAVIQIEEPVIVPPALSVSPGGLTNETTRYRNPSDQEIEVWNSGGEMLIYTITSSVPWLSVSPPATVERPWRSRGERRRHAVQFAVTNLLPGTRHAELFIESNGGTQAVAVTVHVLPPLRHTIEIGEIIGDGTIQLSPESADYPDYATVRVTAVPDEFSRFVSWSGDLFGSVTQRTIVVDGPKTINATFGTGTHLRGRVLNAANGEPLLWANVSVGSAMFLTDADGRYELAVPPGNQEVFVSRPGYSNRRIVKLVERNQANELDIHLQPDYVFDLRAVQHPSSNLVEITYDLIGLMGDTHDVEVAISSDNGRTWTVPTCVTTGDRGARVPAGIDKRILSYPYACSPDRYWPEARVRLTVSGAHFISAPFELDLRRKPFWRLRVWADKNGNGRFDPGEELPNAEVYMQTRIAAMRTDAQGFLSVPAPAFRGAPIFARKVIHTENAVKSHHGHVDNTMFRLWLDSDLGGTDTTEWDGTWRTYTLTHADMENIMQGRTMYLQLAHPVFEWNLVIASERDDHTVLDQMETGLDLLSDFFYYVTDGQMKLGIVALYNNVSTDSDLWRNCDVRVHDSTTLRASAALNGIRHGRDHVVNMAHIRDGQGPDALSYQRTLMHELGHYILGFRDEYEDGGKCDGRRFGPMRANNGYQDYPRQYGLMQNQNALPNRMSSWRDYPASYPRDIRATNVSNQVWWYKLRNGEGEFYPCWQWLEHQFEKTYSGFPVEIIVPPYGFYQNGASTVADRTGPGHIPAPYSRVVVRRPGSAAAAPIHSMASTQRGHLDLLVLQGGQPLPNVRVAQTRQDNALTRRLGHTDAQGVLENISAREGDVLYIYDQGRKIERSIDAADFADTTLTIKLDAPEPAPEVALDQPGMLAIWPIMPGEMGVLVDGGLLANTNWFMHIASAKQPADKPRVTVMPRFGPDVQYELDVEHGVASGEVFLGAFYDGLVEIEIDLAEGGTFSTLDSYTLHNLENGNPIDYYSADGRVRLALLDGLPADDSILLMYQMEGPVLSSAGLVHSNQVGPAVGLHLSNAGAFPPVAGVRASLSIDYSAEDLSGLDETTLTLHHWRGNQWHEYPAGISIERGALVATITDMGTYAIMAAPAPEKDPPSAVDDLLAQTAERHGYVALNWTAPGNDGTNGAAFAYLLRFSESEILDETDWNNADLHSLPLAPASYGTPEATSVQMPVAGRLYHFALRARDQAGQLGELSNPTAARAAINDVDGSGVCAMWFASVNAGRDIPMTLDCDVDGDGLTTREEYFLGTDPNNWDTSGDGMSDGWKHRHGLDPLSAADADLDPDGDGLTNFEEFLLGTDPNNWDTSGDGMSDGWKFRMGLDPLTAANEDGPDADPDEDGFTNLQEYIADTHPLDDTSYLHIQGIEILPDSVGIVLDASTDRHFRVKVTTNLINGVWQTLKGPRPGDGPGTRFEVQTPQPVEILRIEAELP